MLQVGACIVNDENIIVSTGYNGMPHGCHDDEMPWGKSQDAVNDKHSYGNLSCLCFLIITLQFINYNKICIRG